jgi:MoxR-like ATPase
MVIATQNPAEHYGTYPLPESQMDRFLLRIRIDYPSAEDERLILLETPGRSGDALAELEPVLRISDVRALQEAAERTHLEPDLADYIVNVARETRRSPHLALGVSPRGQLAWRNAARAVALVQGRDYVLPDDLKSIAVAVLAHRVVVAAHADTQGRSSPDAERIVLDILDRVPAPL